MKQFDKLSNLLLTCLLVFSLTILSAQEAEEKGDLFLVMTEYVAPEHISDYEQWGKDLKVLAERDGFRPFYVSQDMEAFYYVFNIGPELAGVDKLWADWEEWGKKEPKIGEMYNKYQYTMTHTKHSVWRHSPQYSFSPEGHEPPEKPTYSRAYMAWTKMGHHSEINKLLEEFKTTWTEKGMQSPYDVYFNVFGEDQGAVMIRSAYKDMPEWMAARDDNYAKAGETMMEMITKWNKHIRKHEENEGFPRMDLSHLPGPSEGN